MTLASFFLLAALTLSGLGAGADCTKPQLASLQKKMHGACDKAGTSCKYSLPLATLKSNLATHRSCVALRTQIQTECYNNQIDSGHATAIQQKENAASNCQTLITRKENEAKKPKPAPKTPAKHVGK